MWKRREAESAAARRGAVRRGRSRGIALLIVLWGLVLLAVIAAAFTAETRTEVALARNQIENARAEALADAGVYRAVYGLVAAERRTDFGADVEKVLQGRPALREAPKRRRSEYRADGRDG